MSSTPSTSSPLKHRLHRILRSALRVLVALVVVLAVFGIWVAQPVWVRRGPSVTVADPVRLQAHVRQLSETFCPRSCDDTTNLAGCVEYIRAQFAASGAQVSTQRYRAGAQVFDNVIARWGPATGACVLVGAHYDACGRFPGADDNASGIAGLLELARRLGSAPMPATPIELVAFCTEEPPYFSTCGMGSYPAVMLTDTAFCRNRAYHQSGDTWDKLDYVRMAKVVDGVYGAIGSLQ